MGRAWPPFVGVLLAGLLALGPASCGQETPPPSPDPGLSHDLREAVTVNGILSHAERLQAIADEHGGNRAAGTPGYDASADYVAKRLRGAGYEVEVQSFEFPDYAVVRDADLDIAGTTVRGTDFALMTARASAR